MENIGTVKRMFSVRMPENLYQNFTSLTETVKLSKTEIITEFVDTFCNKLSDKLKSPLKLSG